MLRSLRLWFKSTGREERAKEAIEEFTTATQDFVNAHGSGREREARTNLVRATRALFKYTGTLSLAKFFSETSIAAPNGGKEIVESFKHANRWFVGTYGTERESEALARLRKATRDLSAIYD